MRKWLYCAGAIALAISGNARAEEALLETHVANVVDLLETLGDEVDADRGLELYVEMMSLDETDAAAVLASRLAEDVVPQRRRALQHALRLR